MIEINLFQPEKKIKSKARKMAVAVEAKYFFYLLPFIFGILLCVYIYLAGVNILKSRQLAILNAQWQELDPKRKAMEDFKKEYALSSEDDRLIRGLVKERINWSEKLNKLNLLLPDRIWFSEISVSAQDFLLSASALSLEKEGMSLITEFIETLKKDANFSKDFNNLELTSTYWKRIGKYDIVDFVLTGRLNLK